MTVPFVDLRGQYEALKPEGRLILADYFTDIERKFNPHAVIMGTTMMASTEARRYMRQRRMGTLK